MKVYCVEVSGGQWEDYYCYIETPSWTKHKKGEHCENWCEYLMWKEK